MTFLPEDDREYLAEKKTKYTEVLEKLPDGTERRGLRIEAFALTGNLRHVTNNEAVVCPSCVVLILIPPGYPTTKLDCFYTSPVLKRPDGQNPNATG